MIIFFCSDFDLNSKLFITYLHRPAASKQFFYHTTAIHLKYPSHKIQLQTRKTPSKIPFI